jgi:Tol biopolymer transport system component
MRVCPICGAPATAESAICPVCKSDLLPAEDAEQDLIAEEIGEPQALLAPGASLERWERLMADPARRRQARAALTVLAVVLLLLVQVLAWQDFVHSAWGMRLGTFHQILFVGSQDYPLTFFNASARGLLSSQLYVMRPDGSSLRRLTDPATGNYFSPAWSPDGSRLAAFQVAPAGQSAHLVIMRADGNERHKVPSVALSLSSFQMGNGVVNAPLTRLISWSPDGSQLLAPTGQGSYVIVNADGTHPRPFDGDRPTWAPDSRHIAYYGPNRVGPVFNAAFFPIQLTGSPLVILDTQTLKRQEITGIPDLSIGALAWSPDGRYLAATTWRMDARQQQPVGGVLLLRPNGSDRHRVIQWAGGEADQLSWSPDGRQLAAMVEQNLPLDQFEEGDFYISLNPQLWVVNSDSTHPRNLGTCDTDQPTWAPDGQHLLVVRYDTQLGVSQMFLMDASAEGTSTPLLTAAARHIAGAVLHYVFAPSWSLV